MYNDGIKHGKEHINRPHHIYVEGAYYFIIGRCLEGKKYFSTSQKKDIFVSVLQNLQKERPYIKVRFLLFNKPKPYIPREP